jgi:hypothetical protein
LSAWSSKSFVARWQSAGDGIESSLTVSADGRLHGAIVSRLSAPLNECVLLFESAERAWAFPFGTLSPGQSIQFDRRESQTAETFLAKRRIASSKDESTGYDRAAFDLGRIVEVMMFYQKAGGANYTGLLNRYQGFIDLSTQLELGRAVLVGRGPDGALVRINGQSIQNEEQDVHTTIYRYVLPTEAQDN